MKRVGLAIATGLLTTGLATGCTEAPNPANNDSGQEQIIRDLEVYWQKLGVKGMEGTGSETVVERQKADCNTWNWRTNKWQNSVVESLDQSPAAYCQREQKVVVSKVTYTAWQRRADRAGVSARALDVLVMAHEMGHRVEDKTTSLEASKTFELWADCLGGQAINALYPDLLTEVRLAYDSDKFFPNDSLTHGSRAERATSFQKGVEGIYGCGGGVPIKPPIS